MSCGHGCPSRLLARAALALAAALLCAAAHAQTGDDGAIGGRVLSPSGAPIRGASITARSEDTGLEARATSGRSGDFLLIRLPVGTYRLSIAAPGQPTPSTAPTQVRLGEVTEVEARLRYLTRLVPAADPALGQTELAGLPVPSGQWRALELASSSADPVLSPDGSPGEASFRGIDPSQNASHLDSVSTEESFSGQRIGGGVEEDNSATDTPDDPSSGPGAGSRSVDSGGRRAGAAYIFSGLAVREFRVQAQGDAAQYGSALSGHGAGGLLSTASRSGSLQFHGQAVYTVRSSAWAAADPFSIVSTYNNGVAGSYLIKPHDLRQVYGASLGGPVRLHLLDRTSGTKHGSQHLFFFFAVDVQSRDFPAVSTPGYAGFYSLTPTQTALLANRGVSTAKTAAALTYLSSLTGTVDRRADQDANFGRLDWQRRSGQRLTVEYNRARWSNPAGARTAPVVDRAVSSLGSSFGKADMGVLRYVQSLTPAVGNELRLQYSRQLQYETTQTPLPQEPAIGPGGLPPEVSIGPGGFVFGTPAGLGRRAWPDERRLELADVASWVRGRQLLQFGADFSYIHDYTDSLFNSEGTFSYDSGATNGKAGGLVDWITDYTFGVNAYPNGACPSINATIHDFCFRSYSQSFGQQSLSFSRQEWAGFAQDDWRVSPTFTLHAGLRYEYSFLPLPQNPNAGIDAVFGAQGATSVFPEDRNNLGPRVGVVWQPPHSQGIVRAGYGAYYGRLPGATLQTALLDTAQPSSVSRIRILPRTETVCPQVPTVGFGYPCAFLTQPAGAVAATTAAVLFDRRFRLPLVQQGTLSFERQMRGGIIGRIGYTLNLDRQLPNSVDLNIASSNDVRLFQLQGGTVRLGVRDGETFAVPVYTARINPSFGPVTGLVSNANATYHGMTLEARHGFGTPGTPRVLRGLEFHIAWTWSKAIDFGQNAGARPRSNGQFDPFTVRYDKGLSALNFPHRIVGSAVWTPPAGAFAALFQDGRARRTVHAIAANWSLGAIASETSGRGYSYEIFGGSRLPGGRESINGSGGSRILPTVGRNTLRLPDRANIDLRLSRSIPLPRDGMRIEVRAEAFNLTNHVNITGVEQRAFLAGPAVNGITPLVFQDAATVATEGLNVQPFGTYTSSSASESRAREVQFTVRVEF